MRGQAVASVCLGAAPWHMPGEATVKVRRDGGDVIVEGTVKPVESAVQVQREPKKLSVQPASSLTQAQAPLTTTKESPLTPMPPLSSAQVEMV